MAGGVSRGPEGVVAAPMQQASIGMRLFQTLTLAHGCGRRCMRPKLRYEQASPQAFGLWPIQCTECDRSYCTCWGLHLASSAVVVLPHSSCWLEHLTRFPAHHIIPCLTMHPGIPSLFPAHLLNPQSTRTWWGIWGISVRKVAAGSRGRPIPAAPNCVSEDDRDAGTDMKPSGRCVARGEGAVECDARSDW